MTHPPHASQEPPSSKRILIVEDHPVFRYGITALINGEPDMTVCGEAASSSTALQSVRSLNPDAAVLDIALPGTNGIELTKLIKAERPDLPLLMLSMYDESLYAIRALRAGARGYVMKAEAHMYVMEAIRTILSGNLYISPKLRERLIAKVIASDEEGSDSPVDALSQREREVLELLGKGQGTRQIAESLGLSIKTIETHRAHIKSKLGLSDGNELARFASDWVELDVSDSEMAESHDPAAASN